MTNTNINTAVLIEQETFNRWDGLKAKASAWKEFFNSLDDDDMVHFTDNFDESLIVVNNKIVVAL